MQSLSIDPEQVADPKNRGQSPLWLVLLDVVHRGDGSLRVVLVRVSNESKATAAAGVTILDHDLSNGEHLRQQRWRLARRAKQALEESSRACDVMSGAQHTASSTSPNSSNFWRKVVSSVCQARPLLPVSRQIMANQDREYWRSLPDEKLRCRGHLDRACPDVDSFV